MRVLLIGGDGFIGRHLSACLQGAGDIVFLVNRGDDFTAALDGVDAVVHLACETTPGVSARRPTLEIGNLSLGLKLAEALLDRPGVRLVFLSSGGTVYGDQASSPIAETAPLAPVSFHGAGKAALELFFDIFRREGRPVINVRPANAYGPQQPLRTGFGFIRSLLEHARTGEELVIWGDGESVRDFVYVDDVANAIFLLLQSGQSGNFNVGSGEGHSLNRVLHLARALTGRAIPVRYEPQRSGDVRRVVLDITALEGACEWKPKVDLEGGLSRTWESLVRN